MHKQEGIVAETGWHYSLLKGGRTRVSLRGDSIRVIRKSRVLRDVHVSGLEKTYLTLGLLGRKLTVNTKDDRSWSTAGLRSGQAVRLHQELERSRKDLLRRARERAGALAPDLKSRATSAKELMCELLAGDRFIRYTSMVSVHEQLQAIHDELSSMLDQCDALVRGQLDPEWPKWIGRFGESISLDQLDIGRHDVNRDFIAHAESAAKAAVHDATGRHLTDEQLEAIVTDEDVTLVLAGAGTGKTSVIVSKVVHLVHNEGVAPDDILVLVFNRKAKEEVRDRLDLLPVDLKAVSVHTFHSYGGSIVAEYEGHKPSISKIAEYRHELHQTLDEMIRSLLNDPNKCRIVLDFLLYYRLEYRSPFDFETEENYKDYIRTVELRTLNGIPVKSFEELVIGNYLTENSVAFTYEADYKHDTKTIERRQYQPDFYLPDYDIYIEHFALRKNGESHFGTKYKDDVEWKRDTHAKHGTTLIETYSWQHGKDVLREELHATLETAGVIFSPLPRAALLDQLARQQDSNLSRLLATFLDHAKTSNLTHEELRARAGRAGDVRRYYKFLDLFEQIRRMYEGFLSAEGKRDFHYLIDCAADYLGTRESLSRYRYVLVDEFQDISLGRMALLQALRRSGVAFFVVGDDWQSINRFAGSDVGLMQNCGEHLGYVQRVDLSQTFRFSDSIGTPSTEFAQKNPAQSRRQLRSRRGSVGEGIVIIAKPDPSAAVKTALEEMTAANSFDRPELLILGRYNHSKDVLDEPDLSAQMQADFCTPDDDRRRRTNSEMDYFSTVHRAKGREADNVIVLEVNAGRWGFPSEIDDDPLLDLVLPDRSDKYPHAEERRLFYVALTRARFSVYLITDPARPSSFIKEILECPDIRQIGEIAPKCPRCIGGHLVVSQSAKNLRCANQHSSPKCEYRAPRCVSCRRGYSVLVEGTVVCTNPDCDEPNDRCPKCRVGVMTRARSEYGMWEYCSEKLSERPCQHKRNL